MCGGAPKNPGIKPYPNSRFWESYVNRFLFPQLLSEKQLKIVTSVDHQQLYELVDIYAKPFLQGQGPAGGTLKPHKLTADGLMALLLFKIHENPSDRLLGVIYGEAASAMNHWLNNLRDYIYENDLWLTRKRHLSLLR